MVPRQRQKKHPSRTCGSSPSPRDRCLDAGETATEVVAAVINPDGRGDSTQTLGAISGKKLVCRRAAGVDRFGSRLIRRRQRPLAATDLQANGAPPIIKPLHGHRLPLAPKSSAWCRLIVHVSALLRCLGHFVLWRPSRYMLEGACVTLPGGCSEMKTRGKDREAFPTTGKMADLLYSQAKQ